jgi:hypothetical protein
MHWPRLGCAVAVWLLSGIPGSSLVAQNGRVPRFETVVTVGVHDPLSFEYIQPAREDIPKVALAGEDVVIYWQLFNGFDKPFEIPIPNGRLVDLLGISAVESPVDVAGLGLRFVGFDRIHDYGRTATSPAKPPTATFRLAGGEAIYLRASLLGLSRPGFYRLRVGPAFEGPMIVTNVVEFELRALTGRAERAEFYLHRLWDRRELGAGCRRVKPAIDTLLAVYPHSTAAYEELGACAVNERRISKALSAYSRALGLLDQRLDDLFIGTHRPDQVEQRAKSLKETVATLRAGRIPQPVVHE